MLKFVPCIQSTHIVCYKKCNGEKKCSILTQSITVLNKQHSDNILTVSKSRHCYWLVTMLSIKTPCGTTADVSGI